MYVNTINIQSEYFNKILYCIIILIRDIYDLLYKNKKVLILQYREIKSSNKISKILI